MEIDCKNNRGIELVQDLVEWHSNNNDYSL
jgi:hypothetical protein